VTGTVPTAVILPPTMNGNLTVTGNTLVLNVTKVSALPLTWTAGNGAWDVNASSNWKDATGTSSTYQENRAGAASVVFEDFASGPGPAIAVNLPADVAPASVTFDNSSKSFTLSGPGAITGTTGLTKNGTGTVTLTTSNTYAGATTITGGTLKLGAAGAIPDGTGKGNVTVDGTLDLNAFSETVNGLSGFGTVDSVAGGTPVLTIGNGNASGSFDGIIRNTAGTLGLAKTGTGTLTLAGANTYSGNTEITGGVIIANHATALGSGTVTFNGGTRLVVGNDLDLANDIVLGTNVGVAGRGLLEAGATLGTSTISGDVTVNAGASAGGHFAAPTAGTILHVQGAITSSVLVSLRAGSVMFSGGGTGYNELGVTGTVMAGAVNGIATTASVNLGAYGAAGTLDLNGFNQSLAGITKGGNAGTIGNGSTTADSTLTTTGTSTFAGIIQDAIGLGDKKVNLAVASGALTLTGANTYSGNTTVNAATLALADNAQLKFVLGASSGVNNSLTGAGTVILDGDFVIDTSAADALPSGSWTLENVTTLGGAYGSSFTVAGFVDIGGDQWTKTNGATTYTFNETTGILTLAAAGGYSSWIDGSFAGGATVPLDQQGAAADFDMDGISNLIEYAIAGQDPTVPNPTIGTFSANKLSFAKRVDATGLTYQIQESTDLGVGDAWAQVATYDENNATTISATLTPGTPPRNFLRLQVTSN
jgi:autotransporter-associated beta strand protein